MIIILSTREPREKFLIKLALAFVTAAAITPVQDSIT